jgi:hypothetical protein
MTIGTEDTQDPWMECSTRGRFLFLFFLVYLLLVFLPEATAAKTEFPLEPPPLSKGIFPCSDCHAGMEVNTKRRVLKEAHTDIILHHAENVRWCLDCHAPRNRDKLRLVNGDLIDFTESYLLCAQCHGPIFRDWKAGIHGKRTGYFSGGKVMYYLCVHCHVPHDPRFKPLKPEPPPIRPGSQQNVVR